MAAVTIDLKAMRERAEMWARDKYTGAFVTRDRAIGEDHMALDVLELLDLCELRGNEVANWAHESGTAKGQRDALKAEVERLRGVVLKPLTPRAIEAALHEGRAEAMAATGDNAWTSLLKQRDALRAALREACGLLDDAVQLRDDAKDWFPRIAALRKLAEP